MEFTESLKFRTSKDLKAKIARAAENEGLTISAYLRRMATLWHDGDRLTIERCLVDPGVEYVAGPRMRAAKGDE